MIWCFKVDDDSIYITCGFVTQTTQKGWWRNPKRNKSHSPCRHTYNSSSWCPKVWCWNQGIQRQRSLRKDGSQCKLCWTCGLKRSWGSRLTRDPILSKPLKRILHKWHFHLHQTWLIQLQSCDHSRMQCRLHSVSQDTLNWSSCLQIHLQGVCLS